MTVSTESTRDGDREEATTFFGGRFIAAKRLGRGIGATYEAFDRRDDRWVALKAIEGATLDPRALGARQRVNVPSLVAIDEVIEDDGTLLFVSTLARGEDVRRHVRPGGRLDEGRLRRVVASLAESLAALHAEGLLHGSLRPSNVLVDEAAQTRVLDGAVSAIARSAPSTRGPEYGAPEVLAGDVASRASDLFALGVLLFEMLTGRLPFERGAKRSFANQVRLTAPRVLDLAPDAPEDLAHVAESLLVRDPGARPSLAILSGARGPARLAPSPGPRSLARELATIIALPSQSMRVVEVEGHSSAVDVALALAPNEARVVPLFRALSPVRAYHSLAFAMDALARDSEPGGDDLFATLRETSVLAHAFPALRSLLRSASDVERPSLEDARLRVVDGLDSLFAALAARAPLVVAVDDAREIDADTLSCFRLLLAGRGTPFTILVGRGIEALTEPTREIERHQLGDTSATFAPSALPRSLGAKLLSIAASPLDVAVLARAGALPLDVKAREHRTRHGDRALEIAHADRDATLAAMSEGERRELHALLARLLEETGRADAELLSLHLGEAGRHDESAKYAELAAESARAAHASHRAAELYGRALRLVRSDTQKSLALATRRAECLAAAGRAEEAAEAYFDASRHAARTVSHELVRLGAEQLVRAGAHEQARHALARVLEGVFGEGDGLPRSFEPLVRALRRVTRSHDGGAAEVALFRARMDGTFTASRAYRAIDPRRAEAYAEKFAELARAGGDVTRVARALFAVFECRVERGQLRDAQRIERELETLGEASSSGVVRALGEAARAVLALHAGELDECLALSDTARRDLRAARAFVELEELRIERSVTLALWLEGDLGSLLRATAADRVTHRVSGFAPGLAMATTGVAHAALLARYGGAEGARALASAEASLGAVREPEMEALHLWARVNQALYVEDHVGALSIVAELEGKSVERHIAERPLLNAMVLDARARAALFASFREPSRARSLLAVVKHAEKKLGKERMPQLRALAAPLAASISLRAGGNPTQLATLARLAPQRLDDAGMKLHAFAARMLLTKIVPEAEQEPAKLAAELEAPARFARVLVPGLFAFDTELA